MKYMKYILQASTAMMVVTLSIFAVADAYQSGASYATALLSVTAAVVAMLTLFTAADAERLHRQLDSIHDEVQGIRHELSGSASQTSQVHPLPAPGSSGSKSWMVAAGATALIIGISYRAGRRQPEDGKGAEQWRER